MHLRFSMKLWYILKNMKCFYCFFLFSFFFLSRRYVDNDTFFEELWKGANSIKGRQWYLGGNALSMAQRLVQEGAEVLLGMSYSEKLRALLPLEVKGKNPSPIKGSKIIISLSTHIFSLLNPNINLIGCRSYVKKCWLGTQAPCKLTSLHACKFYS